MGLNSSIENAIKELRAAGRKQRALSPDGKSRALNAMASELLVRQDAILAANEKDVAALPADTLPSFRDRLTLNPERIKDMIESLRQVAALPDPVGEILENRTLPNGLHLKKVRAPLGLILMIFESRPNVILEAFSLAFKSGNSIILRGGSESRNTAAVIYEMMRSVLARDGLNSFYAVEDYDRVHVAEMLLRRDLIDIVVPRGGDRLIEFVQNTARMPVIKNDRGMCHAYVAADADLDMAVKIVVNGKVQRPGVCNSLETVLLEPAIAAKFLPMLVAAMPSVSFKCDAAALPLMGERAVLADDSAWDTEYLDLVLNVRVVADLDTALAHIEKHGSRHSETIITSDEIRARTFQLDVDAAVVYWNASTRFTDGFEFGLGGELGISTQKLHVRGPVGLRELTTPRWIATGNGQVR